MSAKTMTGAEAMVATLEACGVTRVFTNPGTSEMHAVAAIGRAEKLRASLCLFEGVATGAADGYARMTGTPAATLLHLGPGLANGLANLHNARRAEVPIVNIVGDHATSHRALDAPLASDLAGFARPVSRWIASADTPGDVGRLTAEAVAQSYGAPPGIATLILPADTAWSEGGAAAAASALPARAVPDDTRIEAAARALGAGARAAILTGGDVLTGEALELLGRISARSGARLFCDTFTTRLERGAGKAFVKRLPYFAEMAEEELKGVTHLVLAGTKAPVAFFAYPGRKGALTPDGAEVVSLSAPGEDGLAALRALADLLGAHEPSPVAPHGLPGAPSGALDGMKAGAAIARHMPERAIVSDEGATNGIGAFIHSAGAPPHDWLSLMGGSIGQGLPVAVGAATACPDRKTICLHGDGGAMYTIQSLWTAARENLDATFVIFANRSYAILKIELMRTGAQNPGPRTLDLFDLSRPDLSFAGIARSMGVEAVTCSDAEAFEGAFAASMKRRGPFLIEALVP